MIEINDAEWKTTFFVEESPKDTLEVLDRLWADIERTGVVSIDFETNKLKGDNDDEVNPLKDSIFSVALSADRERSFAFRLQRDGKWIYPNGIVEEIRNLFNRLWDSKITKIMHNIKFDSKLIYRIVGKIFDLGDNSWEDTLVMAYLLDENRTVKLKNVAGRYLGIDSIKYENMLNAAGRVGKIDEIPWFIVSQYNCADAWMTRELFFRLKTLMWNEGVEELYENLYKGLYCILLETEIKGFRIDTSYLKSQKKKIEKELQIGRQKLIEFAESNEFNPRSSDQVRGVLVKLGLDKLMIGLTPKGKLSTREEVLQDLLKKDRSGFVGSLLKFRKDEKLRTFVDGLLDREDNGIVRTSFLLHGTVSGRLSSRDPNFQNLPRGKLVKTAFIARDGYLLVVADYSQIELRVVAYYAEEDTMKSIFERNGDIHSATALICFNLDCSEEEVKKKYPEERIKAKMINFGILYGMSEQSLAGDLGCTVEEAKSFIDSYYKRFSRLKELKDRVEKKVIEEEYIENVFGRKRRFPGLFEVVSKVGKFDKEVSFKLREAFNALIQSTAVDICNLGIVKIKKRAIKEGLDVLLLAQVHDEMVWEVKEEDVKKLEGIINEEAVHIIEGLVTPIEIKICKNWGEGKE